MNSKPTNPKAEYMKSPSDYTAYSLSLRLGRGATKIQSW